MKTVTLPEIFSQQKRLEASVAAALEQAALAGASQAEASASAGSGFSVTVRRQDVETLEHHRDQGLSLTVYLGKRKGSASTSDMRPEAISEAVVKACALARYGAEDEAAGLADPRFLATDFPDLRLCHPWDIDVADAIALATRCEGAALASDGRITNSEGATVDSHSGCMVYGNSHGFLAGQADSQYTVSCAVVAEDSSGMQRDYDYTTARNPASLTSPSEVGIAAATAALQRLGARKLNTRTTPVIYPARLARGLFGHALAALRGGALYRRASFLLDCLDKPVFAPHISLRESPFLPEGLASAAFDNEGVATCERNIVTDGVLQSYLLGSYYGRKLGMPTTGNAGGVHNLLVSHADIGFDQLLADMGTGFLVTELMGQGVNSVTGDYSRGAAGFWIENGRLAFPVHEVTLSGNLREIYNGIVAVANDIDCRGSVRSGSVLIDRMTLAGS